ncbi:protein-export chaperone SecB [Flavobacterium sp.]|uniref:protein-export chaperone SecB n=1 Tax=Flavobacterium sp. TaxID=239 RepID=UPI0040479591
MENTNNLESGFRINNLLLLESSFTRVINVTFDNPDIKKNINVDVNVSVNGNVVVVTEEIKYNQIFNEVEEVSAKIKMVGVFEKFGNSDLDLENFGNINGAAIIFPYIREHLTNLTSKAGLGLIIIPPFNFTRKEN